MSYLIKKDWWSGEDWRHCQYPAPAQFLILTNYGIIIETGINGIYFTSEKKNKDFTFHSPILTAEKSKLNGTFYQFDLLIIFLSNLDFMEC